MQCSSIADKTKTGLSPLRNGLSPLRDKTRESAVKKNISNGMECCTEEMELLTRLSKLNAPGTAEKAYNKFAVTPVGKGGSATSFRVFEETKSVQETNSPLNQKKLINGLMDQVQELTFINKQLSISSSLGVQMAVKAGELELGEQKQFIAELVGSVEKLEEEKSKLLEDQKTVMSMSDFRIKTVKQELKAKCGMIEEMTKTVNELKLKCAELEEEQENARREEKENVASELELSRAMGDLIALNAQIFELESGRDELESDLVAKESRFREEKEALLAETESLKENHRREKDTLAKQVEAVVGTSAALQAEKEKFKCENDGLNKMISSIQSAAAAKIQTAERVATETSQAFTSKVAELVTSNDDLAAQLASVEEKHQAELSALRLQIEALTASSTVISVDVGEAQLEDGAKVEQSSEGCVESPVPAVQSLLSDTPSYMEVVEGTPEKENSPTDSDAKCDATTAEQCSVQCDVQLMDTSYKSPQTVEYTTLDSTQTDAPRHLLKRMIDQTMDKQSGVKNLGRGLHGYLKKKIEVLEQFSMDYSLCFEGSKDYFRFYLSPKMNPQSEPAAMNFQIKECANGHIVTSSFVRELDVSDVTLPEGASLQALLAEMNASLRDKQNGIKDLNRGMNGFVHRISSKMDKLSADYAVCFQGSKDHFTFFLHKK